MAAALLRLFLCIALPTQLYHPEEIVNLRLAASLLGEERAWAAAQIPAPEQPPPSPGGLSDEGSSLFDYQYQAWDGGTLVAALILVPIAALLGLTTTSVKAAAILWSLGVMAAWIALMRRLWGTPGALWTAAAFVGVPVPYLITSSIFWGNHSESALFLPLVFLLALRTNDQLPASKAASWSLLTGLVAGFGCYFSLLNLLPLGLLALGLPLIFGLRRSYLALPFGLGAGLGFLPWLGRNAAALSGEGGGITAQNTSIGAILRGAEVDSTPLLRLFETWPRYATWDIHGAWSPDGTIQVLLDSAPRVGLALSAALWLIFVAQGLVRAPAAERPLLRQRLLLLVVLLTSYISLTWLLDRSFLIADRRLSALYPMASILLIGGLLSFPHEVSSRLGALTRRVAAVAVAGLLLLQLGATLQLISSWDRPSLALQPWLHFSPPNAQPKLRTEAGISALRSDEIPEFHQRLRILLSESESQGSDEFRGLRRAMLLEEEIGALRRPLPGCPRIEAFERDPPSAITQPAEARGFGSGLGLRCGSGSPETIERCALIGEPVATEACLTASRLPSR